MSKKPANKKSESSIEIKRHSLAHILATAVLEMFPDAKFGVGPAIENGFYYDFDLPRTLIPEDLPILEEKMLAIIKANFPMEKQEVNHSKALELFSMAKQDYKVEILKEEANAENVTLYKSGPFVDLCRGPHIDSTGEIDPQSFKLTKIAGAYWRGNEKNKMLQRIYGIAFNNKKELQEYIKMQEEAKKRDHRKLGKELDLFTFSEYIGSGLPLYTPRGALVRRLLNDYIENLQSKAGYTQVWTPQLAKAELFKISGHYDKYKEDMFRVVSNYSKEEFYLKPMSCPQHTQIYGSQKRSYRDLPVRYTDFAMLYRDERPGELNGLARVRSFSQDDCHIFCREDQVDKEIDVALEMTKKVMKIFGFKYKYRLSTRDPQHPEKYLGDPKTWDKVEAWAEKIMKRHNIEYVPGPGEAAFYAPKMDLIATDALGREWQLSTIQIDFVMPQRFGLVYTDKDGKDKHPVMIHRAIIGSAERFIMILLEHYSGALPVWLSPVQVRLLPISTEKHLEYAKKIYNNLIAQNIRVEVDETNETLGKKIRAAEMQKIPYLLVVGDKEKDTESVNVRTRGKKETETIKTDEFMEQIKKEIEEKK